MKKEIKEFSKIIKKSNKILVTGHIDPDGDSIGSSLAIYNYLKYIKKDVSIILLKVPKNYDYLKEYDDIITSEDKLLPEYDLLIITDCGDDKRVNFNFKNYTFKNIVVIDHHKTHEHFANLTILDDSAPSACEIVYKIFKQLKFKINLDIAECIYTGLLTDTGSFRNANTISSSFATAEKLVDIGVSPNRIARMALDSTSLNKFDLIKYAYNNIQFIDNNLAYLYIDKKTLDAHPGEDNIHEGLVNYGRNVEGIEVSIFIRELDLNEYKVSMRSNGNVDIAKVSQVYGGGGHIYASGIHYKGNLEDLKNGIIFEIKKQL